MMPYDDLCVFLSQVTELHQASAVQRHRNSIQVMTVRRGRRILHHSTPPAQQNCPTSQGCPSSLLLWPIEQAQSESGKKARIILKIITKKYQPTQNRYLEGLWLAGVTRVYCVACHYCSSLAARLPRSLQKAQSSKSQCSLA